MRTPSIWDHLLPVFEGLGEGLAIYSHDKRLTLANTRARQLLEGHGGQATDPWRFGDRSLDALLHRVLEGDEERVQERVDISGPELIDLRLIRICVGGESAALMRLTEARAEADPEVSRTALLARILPGIAHEVRGPLTTVSGVAQVVGASEEVPSDIRAHLGLVRDQVERADQVLRSATAFARGPGHQEHFPVSLNDSVARAVKLLAYELRTKRLEPELQLATELPLIDADPEELLQLLIAVLLRVADRAPNVPGQRSLQIETRLKPRRRAELRLAWSCERVPPLRDDDLESARHQVAGLGGSLEVGVDGLLARVTLPGADLDNLHRGRAVLAADSDLDQLLACQRELRGVASNVHLASSAEVAVTALASGRAISAIVDVDIAAGLDSAQLPTISVISAPAGKERQARDLATDLRIDWAPRKDAPKHLRHLLEGRRSKQTAPSEPQAS